MAFIKLSNKKYVCETNADRSTSWAIGAIAIVKDATYGAKFYRLDSGPTWTFLYNAEDAPEKQDELVSGTNIKTVNSTTLLGSGNVSAGGSGTFSGTMDDISDGSTYVKTENNYTDAEVSKLSGIATGATANATNAQLRDRSTHTGTQTASTISDFTTAAQTAAPAETGATIRTALGTTTVGANINTLTNPSAISFVKVNADNTVTARTPAQVLSDIGAQASGTYATGTGSATGTNTGDETGAGIRTKLGTTTVGANVNTLTNPGAVTWMRVNADNTVTARTAAQTLSDIGAQAAGTYATGTGTASGTNTGDQTTITGNAGTATALQTARTIGGTSFNGTADITPQNVTIANEATDTTCFPCFVTAATGDLQPKTNAALTFNSNTGSLAATTFVGALTGTASGNLVSGGALGTPSSGTLTNCTFPTLNQNTSGTAANLSGTPELPNGTTATTQSQADNSTKLSTTAYVDTGLGAKQATLVSATNIKTINGSSILGSGDLVVTGSSPELPLVKMVSTANQTVTSGYAAIVPFRYTIGSGFTTAIGDGSVLQIN
jgi:hypothetical protein